MSKKLTLILVAAALAWFQAMAFAQTAQIGQQRIAQPILVNGQQAQGVVVVQNGSVQSYTCASPQQYVTADGTLSGWACFETASGLWLLNAQPPQQQAAPPASATPLPASPTPQATVVYGAPLPTYVPQPVAPAYGYDPYSYYASYYSYGYPYGYYPYGYYPYFVGPRLGVGVGFGFGFGFRGPVLRTGAGVRGGRR